jgi:hypothetical protein
MEILESIGYIALGFVPTLALLEISYKMGKKVGVRRRAANVVISKTPAASAKTKSSSPLLIKVMRGDVR